MKLIIGLGNPGKAYEDTRHNIGFKVVDYLAAQWNAPLTQSKFKGMYSISHRPEGKVMLLKPLTYMNLSGESVSALMDYYGIELKDIIVIYDDLDLPAISRLITPLRPDSRKVLINSISDTVTGVVSVWKP